MALGNLDPPPWTNYAHKPSPTDPSTAQVPDPSWEWAWPEWRINHDDNVDEDGWQYSFAFYRKFSWHRARWWNSFVRRRAWTRMRVRRTDAGYCCQQDPHMLNTEYFTVRPSSELARERSPSRASTRRGSRLSMSTVDVVVDGDEMPDIEHADDLLCVLRASRIDREKIEAVDNYLEHAQEDMRGLQDIMHDIMALFVFQASRRVLLTRLTEVYDKTVAERDRKGKDAADEELDRRVDNLARAIRHADEEVRRLEYWSDVKGMAEEGDSKGAVDHKQGWSPKWQGVDKSGPAAPPAPKHDDDTSIWILEKHLYAAENHAIDGLVDVLGNVLAKLSHAPVIIMTLASALPWRRVCLPPGHIPPRVLALPVLRDLSSLSVPRSPRLAALTSLGCRSFVRTQSTDGHKPRQSPPQPESPTAAEPPSDLLDRLAYVPIRRHGPTDSVLARPVTPYSNRREAREELQRSHRGLYRQRSLGYKRVRLLPPDWRLALHDLTAHTPVQTADRDAFKIILPKHAAELLLSDRWNNLWNIKSRTGCEVTLVRPGGQGAVAASAGEGREQNKDDAGANATPHPDSGSDVNAYIKLRGKKHAVATAVDDILSVTRGATILRIPDGSETHDNAGQAGQPQPNMVQGRVSYFNLPDSCRPYVLNIRADEIPRPAKWTIEAFQEYVAALTMGRIPGTEARRLYPGGEQHKFLVLKLLARAFTHPDTVAVVSNPALKLALRYMARSGISHIRSAERLIDYARTLNLPLDTDTWNLMLELSAKSKNLLAFHSRLKDMIYCGLQPNLRTWTLFLRLIEAEDVRRYILLAMQTKKFFDDSIANNAVASEMANHDIYRAIQLGQDMDTFFALQREVYGSGWHMTRYAANRYLDNLGRYGKFDQCHWLLDKMFANSKGRPNATSLNTVLTHCKHQNKIDLAVEFVRKFDEHNCNVADKVTFHLLFEMARKLQKPQVLGVVFRYAHLCDMTTDRMRHRGIKLLAGGLDADKLTERIRGLWVGGSHRASITRAKFVEAQMLDGARGFSRQQNQLVLKPAPPSADDPHVHSYDEVLSGMSRTPHPPSPSSDSQQTQLEPQSEPQSESPSKPRALSPDDGNTPDDPSGLSNPPTVSPSEDNNIPDDPSTPTNPPVPNEQQPEQQQEQPSAPPSQPIPTTITPSDTKPKKTKKPKRSFTPVEKYDFLVRWSTWASCTHTFTEPLSTILRALDGDRRIHAIAQKNVAGELLDLAVSEPDGAAGASDGTGEGLVLQM
ncbi:hypothetical protein N0V88_000878 [Collariella sp. IMI 366227]|nr:hypothetical protein N0V88_000878 [Collariella sp. IMI 366227]